MEVKISFNKSPTKKFGRSSTFHHPEVNEELARQKSIISNKIISKIKNSNNLNNLILKNLTQTGNKRNTVLNLHLNLRENVVEEIPEILDKLINMGFPLESISLAYNRYKFRTLEQAINIMGIDTETGLYHHQFYLKKFDEEEEDINLTVGNYGKFKNSNICVICNDVKEKHYDLNISDINQTNKVNYSIIGESNHSLIGRDDDKEDISNNLLKHKLKKLPISPTYIENLEKEFKGKDLCIICYANELKTNSYRLPCGHTFCIPCLKTYLESQINECKVENIKCLQAGCKTAIIDSIILDNEFIDSITKQKFNRFKKRKVYLDNIQRGFIPCTAPDCEEWVEYHDDMNPSVECPEGHKFCAKCKDTWHKKGNCTTRHIDKIMMKNTKIRTCPNCGNFIEKEDGCNHMTCTICSFEFCWLCMRKYEYYHYYVFNVKGCPGMRFANPTKKHSLWKNPFIKCLWFFFTLILGILALILICVLWFVLGASYEFIKCYEGDYDKFKEDNWGDENLDSFESESPPSVKQSEKPPKTKGQVCLIYTGLIILGIFVQPFYLLFKMIQCLLEFSRKLGCWFYYMGAQY